VTQVAGLSLAFGAFLAGLVVSESEYRTQVIGEVLPLRDLFASLFFVSVGMLINPATLLADAGLIGLASGVAVLGKLVIVVVLMRGLGLPGRVAVLAGLSVSQVGEFSFVLARVGVESGAIPGALFDLTLATALVTIVLTPSLLRGGPWLAASLARAPVIGRAFCEPVEPDETTRTTAHHAIICGFGRVGRELADALTARGIQYLVVEYNPQVVRELRARGVPVVYGDAGNPAVLEHANVERARLLAVLMPDRQAAELATRAARAMQPRLDIVARASQEADLERLRSAGATEVVQPEFEAGVEVIRHALRRFGIGGVELQALTTGRRAAFYRHAR
jgi:monovalent cation:H+ antiporter-2, CPA2 family